jgi:hypothetical protein
MYRDGRDDSENIEDFEEDRKSESHSEEDMSFYPMSMHGYNSCPYMKDNMMPQMHTHMPKMQESIGGCCPFNCQNMQDFEMEESDDESSDMYRRKPYYNPYYNFYNHPYHPYHPYYPYHMKQHHMHMPWWMYQK